MASATGAIRVGAIVAATSPSWAGRARGARGEANWLPRPDESWFDPRTGRPSPRFYQFMREIAETRLGGVNGSTVTEVATSVSNTQTDVAAAITYSQSVASYAQGVAATANATAEVAQNSGLSGASSIPPPPDPPQWDNRG